MHEGVDFAVPIGPPVYAASDGVIARVCPYASYGNYVRIDHGDDASPLRPSLALRAGPGPRVDLARSDCAAAMREPEPGNLAVF
jgi:hypothetical protein